MTDILEMKESVKELNNKPFGFGGTKVNLGNFYITSDLHFDHKNIIKYCDRPFTDTEEMNEKILRQFDMLPANSTIINNGDIAMNGNLDFGRLESFTKRMRKFNKTLWLVLGNHDREIISRCKKLKSYESPYSLFTRLFDRVFPFPILLNGKYLLSHEPIYLEKGSNLLNLHGHLHDVDVTEDFFGNNDKVDLKNYFNVCWDKSKRIIPLAEILKS